jgi:hypothetical protein
VELQDLLIIELKKRPVVDPDYTVNCRALALEHAQHRLALLVEELPGARIREAPQLPVIWQIPRSIGDP